MMSKEWTLDESPVIFKGREVNADYNEPELPEFAGNPLLEALPWMLEQSDVARKLTYNADYAESDRLASPRLRSLMTGRIGRFFEPLPKHLELEDAISCILREGYIYRNPIKFDYEDLHRKALKTRDEISKRQYIPPRRKMRLSFALPGISGIGKTSAIEAILCLYPQIINHGMYKARRLTLKQLVWLKIDCPPGGSTRGLCLNFFQAIDSLYGTHHYQTYGKSGRASKDDMLPWMAYLCGLYHIGMLIIDEIQNLTKAPSGGSEEMLNFFTSLSNNIGVPIVVVGTYSALSLLNKKMAQARRSSGPGHDIWSNMPKDSTWDLFMEAMWTYQFTNVSTPLSNQLNQLFHFHTCGIPDLATKLYIQTQKRLIGSDDERITPEIIAKTANEKFTMLHKYLDALRGNKPKAMEDLDEIYPGFLKNYEVADNSSTDYSRPNEGPDVSSTATRATPDSSPGKPPSSADKPPEKGKVREKVVTRTTNAKPTSFDFIKIVSEGTQKKLTGLEALERAGHLRPVSEYGFNIEENTPKVGAT
jgi:hypothetical protein